MLHRFGQGNSEVRGFGEISRPQSVCGKLLRLQPGHRHPPLDDIVDRLRVDRPKHATTVDLRGRQPGVQRVHRPAGEIDNLILACARILAAAEVDGERAPAARRPCASWIWSSVETRASPISRRVGEGIALRRFCHGFLARFRIVAQNSSSPAPIRYRRRATERPHRQTRASGLLWRKCWKTRAPGEGRRTKSSRQVSAGASR